MPDPPIDYLIIGQGLAGTTLAWALLRRGVRVLVLDAGEASTCSRVAAGLITPITGRRLAISWRAAETLPAAWRFYQAIERETGARFAHGLPVARFFPAGSPAAAMWEKRRADPAYAPFIGGVDAAPPPGGLPGGYAGFAMRGSGFLDTAAYLDASRAAFAARGAHQTATVAAAAVKPMPDGGVAVDGTALRAKAAVFCEGYRGAANPHFSWLPFKGAKGEILDLRLAAGFPRDRILNGSGSWVLPDARGGFRAGSNYEFGATDPTPTDAGRAEVERALQTWFRAPYEVAGQRAGIRPIIRASKVAIGRHPAHPQLAIFNGLGSKGSMNAPYFAEQLAAHLEGAGAIDADVDIRRNF